MIKILKFYRYQKTISYKILTIPLHNKQKKISDIKNEFHWIFKEKQQTSKFLILKMTNDGETS